MVSDYILLRRTRLDRDSLYRHDGPYEYSRGFNVHAIVALTMGVVAALVGLVAPPLRPLYDYAWFVGFIVSAALYLMMMRNSVPCRQVQMQASGHAD